MADEYRPDSETLLRELRQTEDQSGGRLKIFFGYAAGVGKTYAMLEAAHRAKEAGVDVVAGYIEPHTRPETPPRSFHTKEWSCGNLIWTRR